jgi:hypothetical protein
VVGIKLQKCIINGVFGGFFKKITLLVLIKFNNVISSPALEKLLIEKSTLFQVAMANFVQKLSLAPLLL